MPNTTRVTLNPNFAQQLAARVEAQRARFEKELNETLNSRKGEPVEELYAALAEVANRCGIKANPEFLREKAEKYGAEPTA